MGAVKHHVPLALEVSQLQGFMQGENVQWEEDSIQQTMDCIAERTESALVCRR